MARKNSFVTADLEWAETQLAAWKAYVDANPLHQLKDRIEWKATARGASIPMLVASIESQGKFIQETMKNYLLLLEVVDKLREREESKTQARGDSQIPQRMKKSDQS